MHHSSKILLNCYSLTSNLQVKHVPYRRQDGGSVGSLYVSETPNFFTINPLWPSMITSHRRLLTFVTYLCILHLSISILFNADFNKENLEGTKIAAYNFGTPKFLTPAAPMMLPIERAHKQCRYIMLVTALLIFCMPTLNKEIQLSYDAT